MKLFIIGKTTRTLKLVWNLLSGISLYDWALHLSLNFRLSKMSWNEKPSWLRSQNSEKPRIFQVTGANQNARKLLFTDWVNTKSWYTYLLSFNRSLLISKAISPFWTSSNFMAAVSNISTSIISNTAGFPYLQQRKTICVRSEQLEKHSGICLNKVPSELFELSLCICGSAR